MQNHWNNSTCDEGLIKSCRLIVIFEIHTHVFVYYFAHVYDDACTHAHTYCIHTTQKERWDGCESSKRLLLLHVRLRAKRVRKQCYLRKAVSPCCAFGVCKFCMYYAHSHSVYCHSLTCLKMAPILQYLGPVGCPSKLAQTCARTHTHTHRCNTCCGPPVYFAVRSICVLNLIGLFLHTGNTGLNIGRRLPVLLLLLLRQLQQLLLLLLLPAPPFLPSIPIISSELDFL